jgi:hypothetical protein
MNGGGVNKETKRREKIRGKIQMKPSSHLSTLGRLGVADMMDGKANETKILNRTSNNPAS